MKKIIVILSLAIFANFTGFSQKLNIHKTDGTITTIALSTIDSITFTTSNIFNIVFQTNRGGGQQIWIVRSDGTGLKALTTEGWTYKFWPRLSPDGAKIAFVGGDTYSYGNTIRIIDTDGVFIKDIVTTASIVGTHGICWSPDGQWIYYDESITCNDRIRKVNVANNLLDSIVVDEANYSQVNANVSPNGTKMLFANTQCGGISYLKMFDFSLNSSVNFVQIASIHAGGPKWQSDGAKVAYTLSSSTTPYTSQIAQCNDDGTEQTTITTCQGSFPNYVLNDSKIVFSRPKNDDVSTGLWNIWMMNTDGSNLIQITYGDYADQFVDTH